MIYSSGSSPNGFLGVEIWIRKDMGIHLRHVHVALADPRFLHVTVRNFVVAFDGVGIHVPHYAHPLVERRAVFGSVSASLAYLSDPSSPN